MFINYTSRYTPIWKNCYALSLSILLCSINLVSFATPPTPPAKIILNERIAAQNLQKGILPVSLQFRENVSALNIQVKARPVIEGKPEFEQPKFEIIQEQRLDAASIRKTAKSPILVHLEKLKPGQYDLEIFILGQNQNNGFSDKQIWRLIITPDGQYQLVHPRDVVKLHVEQKERAFAEQLRKDPKNPDIRLLMDDTVKPPLSQGQTGTFDIPESRKIQVLPGGPSERFKGYYQEHADQSWSSTDPITVKGRLWFQDVDGVWKPLVNAAVHLWDDDTFGDEHLGSVATDWDGRWSFSVNNDDGFLQDGRDLYYTFKLQNTRWKVGKCGGDYEWKSSVHDDLNDGIVLNFGDETASTNINSLIVFNKLNLSWNHITTVGGQDPGFIEACFPGGGTFYDGKVNVAAADFDGDGVSHEYGHALMDKANGSDPSPGGPHGFGDCNQNQALSWSEGWATGFMLSVFPDNRYNWHAGDTGQNLENFSSSCHLGETSEGRVAGSLLDFMDSANDNNGGSLNLGRNDVSDNNNGHTISLAKIFRDTLWGNSPNNNFLNFWYSLSGEVNSTQRSGGANITYFNWMSVLNPNACVATKVTTANLENPEPVLAGLRAFRDLVLKKFPQGREFINLYYHNSPEMAKLLLDNPANLNDALNVVQYFSNLGNTIGNNQRYKKAMAENQILIPENIKASSEALFSLFEQKGGDTLKQDITTIRKAYEQYGSLNLSQFQETVIREKNGQDINKIRLQQGQFTKESQQALRDPRLQKILRKELPNH